MSAETFSEVAPRLSANGFLPVPVRRKGKEPIPKDWPAFTLQDGDVVQYADASTGVICGYVVACDIDCMHEDLAARLEALARNSLGVAPRRIGQAPKVLLVYRTEKPFAKVQSRAFRLPDDAENSKLHRVEFLANGQQFVAFGMHPIGRPFEWIGAGSLLDFRADQLTVIDEKQARAFVAEAEELFEEYGGKAITEKSQPSATAPGAKLKEGGRNDTLFRMASAMRSRGYVQEAIEAATLVQNAKQCDPPLPEAEVLTIAGSASKYPPFRTNAVPMNIFRQAIAPQFDFDDVPPVLAELARASSESTGFDRSGIIVAGVCAAAAMIDHRYMLDVRPEARWHMSAILWVLLIGSPGSGKSPILKDAFDPVKRQHADMYRAWLKECEELPEGEKKPPMPALFTSDATIEALSERLRSNPRGMICQTEEFGSWFGQLDCYRGGSGSKDRGNWLEAFDGGPRQIDRINRGNVFVPNWGVSLAAACTPAGLRKHSRDLPEDGLIHRFMPCILRTPEDAATGADKEHALRVWNVRLREVFIETTSESFRPVLRFAFDAQGIFETEYREIRQAVNALDEVYPAFAAHLAKHGGLLARVALVFHVLDGRRSQGIEVDTLQKAIAFMRKVRRHANVLFGSILGNSPSLELARSLARSITASKEHEPTIGRYWMSQHCKAFAKAEDSERKTAVQLLEDANWISPVPGSRPYGGWSATEWLVDERVYEIFAVQGEEHRRRRDFVVEAILTEEYG